MQQMGQLVILKLKNQPLDKFIPRQLMTKFEAARAQDAMVGERRVITMLFCDVKGSTAAAEKWTPKRGQTLDIIGNSVMIGECLPMKN